jgi:hypothetical protein
MRYATAAASRQALDDRLRSEASSTGLPLARLRKQVAFELFPRLLVAVAPDRFVLEGALEFRLKATTRPTRDIDLGRDDDARVRRRGGYRLARIVLSRHTARAGLWAGPWAAVGPFWGPVRTGPPVHGRSACTLAASAPGLSSRQGG